MPAPTESEMRLRAILHERSIPFTAQMRIWYTTKDYYTPDFLVGTNMIVEVEGGVHEDPRMFRRDRIRRRALVAMGYEVMRLKNQEVEHPGKVADRIIQRYYETTEASRRIRVVQLKSHEKQARGYSEGRIKEMSRQASEELAGPDWTVESSVMMMSQMEPGLVQNQAAMDLVMLNCFGLNLRAKEAPDGGQLIDFDGAFRLFERSLAVMKRLFGESGSVGMTNLLNISAPNLFKNLVFKGGPNVNPGLAKIVSADSLQAQIKDFNANFGSAGIHVEDSDVVEEIRGTLRGFRTTLPDGLKWVSEL